MSTDHAATTVKTRAGITSTDPAVSRARIMSTDHGVITVKKTAGITSTDPGVTRVRITAAIITGMKDTMYRQSAAAAVPTSRRRRTSWWQSSSASAHPRLRSSPPPSAPRPSRPPPHLAPLHPATHPPTVPAATSPANPFSLPPWRRALCAAARILNALAGSLLCTRLAILEIAKQTNRAAISNQRSIRHVRQHAAPLDSLSDTRLPSMSPSIAPTPLRTRLKRSSPSIWTGTRIPRSRHLGRTMRVP